MRDKKLHRQRRHRKQTSNRRLFWIAVVTFFRFLDWLMSWWE